MRDKELFILTFCEITAIIFLWSRLENCLQKQYWKKVIFSVLVSLSVVFMNHFQVELGNFINFIFAIVLICILFRITLLECIFQFCIILAIGVIIELLLSVPLLLINNTQVYTYRNGIVINLSFLIISILMNQYIPLEKIKIIFNKQNKICVFISINSITLIAVILYLWQMNQEYIWKHILLIILVLTIWIVINTLLVINFIKIHTQKKKLELHEQYIPVVESLLDEMRRKQHDFKNHLHVIYGLIETSEEKQLKDHLKGYLHSLVDTLRPIDLAFNIQDPILCAVIYSKKCDAKIKKIDFNYNIKHNIDDFPLEDYEMVEIVGNLIDNAFEVQQTSLEYKQEVIFNMGIENDKKFIEVKNTGKPISSDSLDNIFDKGYSTKKGKHRGYGLYNVKKIVECYNGVIEASQENEYTCIKILF